MKKQNLLFSHQVLKSIGDAIIMVFIPIYIIKETNDFKLAIFYLTFYSSFTFIFLNILKKIIKRFGVICILFCFAFVISAQSILSFAPINIYSVLLVSICMGLYQSLYSVPLNILFTFSDNKANVGKLQIGGNVGKVIFTLASGLLLSSDVENSFLISAIVSSIFYVCSTIPLFICFKDLKEEYKIFEEKPKVRRKIDWYFAIFHMCFGVFQPVMDHLMPIFLYINNLSFESVTIVIVIIELGKLLSNYIAQLLVNHNKAKLALILSGIIFTSSIIVLIFNRTQLVLYIFSIITSLSFPLTIVTMLHTFCKKVKEEDNVFNGLLNRDLHIFSFRPLLYSLALSPLGMVSSFIFGLVSIPIMVYSGIKILNRDKK